MLHRPEMVGMLLEHISNLDPLYIVNMVPNGLQIPRLGDRLVKIITDYRTETSLRHGCNDILKADCVNLLVKYYKEARHAVCLGGGEDEVRPKRDSNGRSASSEGRGGSMKKIEVKYKTRGGGRCCMCFDPFSIQDVYVTVFFCCHAYHTSCLMDSMHSLSNTSENDDSDDNDDENKSSLSRTRCILCTTAAQ